MSGTLARWFGGIGPGRGGYGAGLSWLMLMPLLVLLFGVYFWPLVKLLATSVFAPNFTTEHYVRLAVEPLYLKILLRTLWISFLVTVFTLILGYPVAFVMARLKGWQAGLVAACVLIPLWTSVLVRSYAWIVLLQRNGIINNWLREGGVIEQPLQMIYTEGAVLMAMTHVLLPLMILPIYSVLRNIPADFGKAALNLGASRWGVFRYVIFPLSLPGVSAGVLFTFILALGFYITPALVGGPRTLMVATLIGQQVTELLNWPFAGALSTVLLAVTLGTVVAFKRLLGLEKVVGHGD